MNRVIIIVCITVSALTTLFIFLSNVKHSQTVIKSQLPTPSGASPVEHRASLENSGGACGTGYAYAYPVPYTIVLQGENPVGESPSPYLICGGHGGGSHDSVCVYENH